MALRNTTVEGVYIPRDEAEKILKEQMEIVKGKLGSKYTWETGKKWSSADVWTGYLWIAEPTLGDPHTCTIAVYIPQGDGPVDRIHLQYCRHQEKVVDGMLQPIIETRTVQH